MGQSNSKVTSNLLNIVDLAGSERRGMTNTTSEPKVSDASSTGFSLGKVSKQTTKTKTQSKTISKPAANPFTSKQTQSAKSKQE